jgi:transposase
MAYNFHPVNRKQQYLMPISMEDWLPEKHLVWFILDAMEHVDLTPFYKKYREDGSGGASFDPGMMMTLLVYSYSQGLRSSRRIEKKCQEEITFRIITANQMPDHSTIARFRKNHQKRIQELFVEVLRLCRESGLGDLQTVAVDGTKIEANAALAANRTKEGLEKEVAQILKEAEEIDQQEDQKYGADRRGDELPEELCTKKGRQARLQEAMARLEQEEQVEREKQAAKIAEREAEEAKGEKRRGRKLKSPEDAVNKEAKANVTDPESRIMKTSKGYVQGYNAQAVVSKDQLILAADVTQEENDQHQLLPMVEQTQSNLKVTGENNEVEVYLADAGYCNAAVLEKIATEKQNYLIATQKDWKQREAMREQGCPRGRIPIGLTDTERMERELLTKHSRQQYAWRGKTVEPVFGQIKDGQGCRRFSCRGSEAVRSEWRLVCAVHNLMKLYRSGKAVWN